MVELSTRSIYRALRSATVPLTASELTTALQADFFDEKVDVDYDMVVRGLIHLIDQGHVEDSSGGNKYPSNKLSNEDMINRAVTSYSHQLLRSNLEPRFRLSEDGIKTYYLYDDTRGDNDGDLVTA